MVCFSMRLFRCALPGDVDSVPCAAVFGEQSDSQVGTHFFSCVTFDVFFLEVSILYHAQQCLVNKGAFKHKFFLLFHVFVLMC